MTGDLGAQAPVDVLRVGEEALVEGTDLVQRRAPVDRRAAAGAEDRLGRLVAALRRLAMAAAGRLAAPAQRVARAVEHRAVVVVDELRAGRAGLGMGVERRHQL